MQHFQVHSYLHSTELVCVMLIFLEMDFVQL